jgi:hypothetical protein
MNRDTIEEQLEHHLDSMHFTYSQHFAVANANRWLGRLIDVSIFTISSAVVITRITASLSEFWLIFLLLLTAALSAVHRATKPGEQEKKFRESARSYHDLFKRGQDFLKMDLHSDELSDMDVRERYDALFNEYLELNRESPDASTTWYKYMKYIRGGDQMQEEITTRDSKREALKN